jgi:hypothetical protein
MVAAMRSHRFGLWIGLVLLAVACQATGSPVPSSSPPGASDIAPDIEPSATPEAPLESQSLVAPDVEPSQTPEQPLVAPVVPSDPPETPLPY